MHARPSLHTFECGEEWQENAGSWKQQSARKHLIEVNAGVTVADAEQVRNVPFLVPCNWSDLGPFSAGIQVKQKPG